jgi:CubicO group peptidase (beta-lactamase class C family)
VPAKKEMTVHHLLTHTSGLAYGFSNPRLAKLYEKADIPSGISQAEGTLAEHIRRLAALPLAHEPGDAFTYGLSSDVLGRVVEVASGQSLDAFFRERIFKPLGMHDTMFYVPAEKQSRLAALYALGADKALSRAPEEPVKGVLTFSAGYPYRGSRTYFSGGGGLVGTVPDYARFLQMLLNGGELDGVRILKAETVKRMTSDQLGKANVPQFMAGPHGDRFGYGFGVVTMPPKDKTAPAVGSFSWGGAFRTYFWVDPQNQMLLVLMTQVAPFDVGMGLEARKRVYEAME